MCNSCVWHVSPGCTQMSWASCWNTSRSPSASLRMNESCRTYEWAYKRVMAHMNDWHEWVMSHMHQSNVGRPMHLCISAYEWVMSHTCMIHTCGSSNSYVSQDSSICVPWLICSRDMTKSYICGTSYSYMSHDSSLCVPCLMRSCDMPCFHQAQFTWFPCHILVCDMTNRKVRDMTYSYRPQNLFTWVSWHICMCDKTHSYVWHD